MHESDDRPAPWKVWAKASRWVDMKYAKKLWTLPLFVNKVLFATVYRFLNSSGQQGGVMPRFRALLAFVCLFLAAAAEPATLTITEAWGNLEAGTNAEFHAVIQSPAATRGNLQWSVTVGPRPIIRREIEVAVEAGRPAVVPIQFSVPPLKDDLAINARLTVTFQPQGAGPDQAVSSPEKTLWFFAANPFANHATSLEKKKIALFDPEGKTQKRFEESGIPFVLVPRLDAIANIKEGLLIVGEGIALPDFRTLGDLCLAVAARGVPVLCLALREGQFRLIDRDDKSLPPPQAMSYRHSDIIKNLDKRLDADAWPPDGVVASHTLAISGGRGPIVADVADGRNEWPWIEMTYASNTRAIFCQFDIVGKWEVSPAPRYLLAALLDYLLKK